LMAYEGSRAFLLGKAGSVYDTNAGAWAEPTPEERERALGYGTGATAAPGLDHHDRHILTGNCIDQAALSVLVRECLRLAVPAEVFSRLLFVPVRPPQMESASLVMCPVVAHRPMRCEMAALQLALATDLVVAAVESSDGEGQQGLESETREPEQVLAGNQLLARKATEAEACDIHEDGPVLAFLRGRSTPDPRKGPSVLRRVVRRARRYELTGADAGLEVLYRVMADGSRREVPHPSVRALVVERAHALSGHFGARRTLHLIHGRYWWQGLQKDVQAHVGSCAECDRVRASFSHQVPVLRPLPIEGLFFRWGVDTSGPYERSKRGNAYILHAVEHFSSLMVAVPMPSKESAETAYAFSTGVLAYFGSSAQVLTDNGGEYQGQFTTLMQRCHIDHRTTSANHPQSNGLAERAVQTVKRSLRKLCEATLSVDAWDEQLPWIVLAYNCSKQASTKLAPYHLLYAREPTFPTGTGAQRMREVLPDADTPPDMEQVATNLARRAQYIQQVAPLMANNLAIAQHRDTQRYAHIRSGSFIKKEWAPVVGDMVYMRRRNSDNTLQVEARPFIVRVTEVRPSGVVVVQGKCGGFAAQHVSSLSLCHIRGIDVAIDPSLSCPPADLECEVCRHAHDEDRMLLCDVCNTGWHLYCLQPPLTAVPAGDWVCPACTSQGITKAAVGKGLITRREPTRDQLADRLFVPAAAKPADKEAQRLAGQKFTAPIRLPNGKVETLTGTVRYRGGQYRPYSLEVQYSNGFSDVYTPAEVRGLLRGGQAQGKRAGKGRK
ncbi:MAG TPA: DDE-type integrase/transposase/recombinase, partial [Burkholderiaceae bacterium]|nr:DDE-type integrase/transposase/recombinase [Burkholderiaceae bacterium]